MYGYSAELFKRQVLTKKRKKNLPTEKVLALTLHFLSPKAYSYVRSVFDSCAYHVQERFDGGYEGVEETGVEEKQVFVLMAVAINSSWKVQIG